MNNPDTARRERLIALVRARLEADPGPHSRALLESALEAIPTDSELLLENLEETLAMSPERLERELRNLHNARSTQSTLK